jgi:hypothetical protein
VNLLEQLGIAFLILSITTILGFLIWFIYDISNYPKQYALLVFFSLKYSLKYVACEIRDLRYQNPQTENNANAQKYSRPKRCTNYDIILSQFNKAINTISKTNSRHNKIHNPLPWLSFDSVINHPSNEYKQNNYGDNKKDSFPVNIHTQILAPKKRGINHIRTSNKG